MANGRQLAVGLEWRVAVPEGSSVRLEHESGPIRWLCSVILGSIVAAGMKVLSFFKKVWKIGVDDPRKVVHCLKVGLGLALVSLFYYTRPLYDGVGGSALWAVMTVVVIFEFTVGASLYKGFNRVVATILGGSLGLVINSLADTAGEKGEPVILDASLFLLASAATFTRFIPTVKVFFDYGITVFILTYSLVSVSGYRVDKVLELAQQRMSTIAIGCSICLMISMVICPVWAGEDLHHLIVRNMEKLANSIEGNVAEYFKEDDNEGRNEKPSQRSQDYKCVLNSKASEESHAILARWEPAHARFSFRHPWKQYLTIGASLRSCAYCVEALHGIINSQVLGEAPKFMKKHLSNPCVEVSSHCSRVLEELANSVKTMTKSGSMDFLLGEMNSAVDDLQSALRSLPTRQLAPLPPSPPVEGGEKERGQPISVTPSFLALEVLPLATIASLLGEISARIECVADAVDALSELANFRAASDEKPEKAETSAEPPQADNPQGQEAMKGIQMV
uniref:Aluminum-activated malate transporter 10 n=1 Tax=Anthurium amnicola TaxID=1678845 RepID=A0A1D1YDL5_9ARAE